MSAGQPVMRNVSVSSIEEITPSLWGTLTGATFRTNAMAWAVLPTGQVRLAAIADDDGGENVVHLWDGLTGAKVRTLAVSPGDPGKVGIVWGSVALAARPDGRLLVAANSSAAVQVWDSATGEPLHVMNGTKTEALAWARTSAGVLVLVAAAEHRITVLDGGTGREITAIDVVNDGYFRSLAATSTPDGAILVAAAWKRNTPARIWRIEWDIPEISADLEATSGDDLSPTADRPVRRNPFRWRRKRGES